MKKLVILPLFFLFAMSAFAQNKSPLQGDWKGGINLQGTQLPIKTHVQKSDAGFNGTIDIQGVTLPLQNIRITKTDSVYFQFTTNVNVAKFKGVFSSDSTITGKYHQAGQKFSFELKRSDSQTELRQTTAQALLPYNHEELIIKNDSVNIGGTLTWPENGKAKQLVIMISGSGAQDRDETMKPISNFKPFAVLADSLTTSGIATFRFDDRGVGQSTGNFRNATLDILADDVDAIIQHFTNQSDQSFDQIILLGHSQGGVVGGKAAAKNKAVDKLILMASPGIKLSKVLHYQLKQRFLDSGFEEVKITAALTALEDVFKAINKEEDVQEAKKHYMQQFSRMFKSLPEQAKMNITNLDSTALSQGDNMLKTFTNPQMQSLMLFDPASDLRKLDIPVLVLFGGKDTQVTVDMNKEPIEKALDAADVSYQTKIFKEANHPFQKAKTGQVQEYGSLPKQFVEGFTSTIEQWVKK